MLHESSDVRAVYESQSDAAQPLQQTCAHRHCLGLLLSIVSRALGLFLVRKRCILPIAELHESQRELPEHRYPLSSILSSLRPHQLPTDPLQAKTVNGTRAFAYRHNVHQHPSLPTESSPPSSQRTPQSNARHVRRLELAEASDCGEAHQSHSPEGRTSACPFAGASGRGSCRGTLCRVMATRVDGALGSQVGFGAERDVRAPQGQCIYFPTSKLAKRSASFFL